MSGLRTDEMRSVTFDMTPEIDIDVVWHTSRVRPPKSSVTARVHLTLLVQRENVLG